MIKKTGIIAHIASIGNDQMVYNIVSMDLLYYHYSLQKTRKLDFIVGDAVEFEISNNYSINALNTKRVSLNNGL